MAEMLEEPKCATCPMRLKAEEKPKSLIARFWRWHTRLVPGLESLSGVPRKRGVTPHNQLPELDLN